MQHAVPVHVRQRGEQVASDGERIDGAQAAAPEPAVERLAVDERHHEVHEPVVRAVPRQRDEAGTVERLQDGGLVLQPQPRALGEVLGARDLDDDALAGRAVDADQRLHAVRGLDERQVAEVGRQQRRRGRVRGALAWDVRRRDSGLRPRHAGCHPFMVVTPRG